MGQIIPGTQVSLANDRGAIAKQSTSPGTAQSGANINVDGAVKAGTTVTAAGTVRGGSVTSDTYISATTDVGAGGNVSATGYVNSGLGFQIGGVYIFATGSTFPSSPFGGQRYYHTTYRSWFTYNSTDSKWYQEGPGVFNGSFPTVASGDNTVAPKIQVQRIDLNNTIFYYDGTNWHYATNQIVLLAAPARLIDANSGPYAASYNTLITATSTNTFVGGTPTPAKLAAVFLSVTLIGNAVGTLSARLENPSALTGATSISSYAGVTNVVVTGMVVCGVNSSGQIKFTNGATALSRFVIDVVGYQLDLI